MQIKSIMTLNSDLDKLKCGNNCRLSLISINSDRKPTTRNWVSSTVVRNCELIIPINGEYKILLGEEWYLSVQNITFLPSSDSLRAKIIPYAATWQIRLDSCDTQARVKLTERRQISSNTGKQLQISGNIKQWADNGRFQTKRTPRRHAIHKSSMLLDASDHNSQP